MTREERATRPRSEEGAKEDERQECKGRGSNNRVDKGCGALEKTGTHTSRERAREREGRECVSNRCCRGVRSWLLRRASVCLEGGLLVKEGVSVEPRSGRRRRRRMRR